MNIDKSKVIIVSLITVIVVFLIAYPVLLKKNKKVVNEVEIFQVPEEVRMEHEERIIEAFRYDKNKNYLNTFPDESEQNETGQNNMEESPSDSLRQLISDLQQQVAMLRNSGHVRHSTSISNSIKESHIEEEKDVNKNKEEQIQERRIVKNEFYGLKNSPDDMQSSHSINAVIPVDQSVSSGSKVKIRTTEKAIINGWELNKNSYLYGKAQLSKERVLITINSLLIGDKIVDTDIKVYDIDGNMGIYTPGLLLQDVASENVNRGIGNANINLPIGGRLSLNPIKKQTQQTVTLLSNHKIILSLN